MIYRLSNDVFVNKKYESSSAKRRRELKILLHSSFFLISSPKHLLSEWIKDLKRED
jgi:hypothetical protein